jgi:2-iminobutanoate/2-iminopropanoate deaminase
MDKFRIAMKKKQKISSTKVFEPAPRVFSNAIKYGNLIFTTAKSGTDQQGKLAVGIRNQTRQALENIRELLETAGTDMEHVLKTTVYLKTTRNFDAMNKVYSSFFEIPPARAIVLTKGWGSRDNRLVEIKSIAGMA